MLSEQAGTITASDTVTFNLQHRTEAGLFICAFSQSQNAMAGKESRDLRNLYQQWTKIEFREVYFPRSLSLLHRTWDANYQSG